VLQYFFDFSRLQDFYERQRPTRRSFYYEPNLRNLRRQSRDLRLLRAKYGVRRSAAGDCRVDCGKFRSGQTPSNAIAPEHIFRLTQRLLLCISAKKHSPNYTPETPKRGRNLKFPKKQSAAVSTKPCAAFCRITSSSAKAKSPIIIRIRRLRGTPIRATFTECPDRMKMPCRTRRFSRKTDPITSKV